MSYRDIGWRSFNAAVSDVAAMGADAFAALSAIELPSKVSDRALYEIVEGQAEASKRLACPIAGGNLARSDGIAITTSVLGRVGAPLLRQGAKPDDEVWLIGEVGLAAAGLICLLAGKRRPRGDAVDRCIEAFRRPVALLAKGKKLVGRAHSAIDISDGLAGDACHVAESSSVALVIDSSKLTRTLSTELIVTAGTLGRRAIDLALYGGEDYALLATGPRAKRPRFAKTIGRVQKGQGCWLTNLDGQRVALGRGFDHFRHSVACKQRSS
jgi:thiamine-monophosphate kinase